MKLTSDAFNDGAIIPSRFTCEGLNHSPPLTFHDVPKNTKSLALIMDDPDVPSFIRPDCMFDHWVVFDLSPYLPGLLENASPPGTHGQNTAGENKYYGPCPPDREHRYFFKLYALDTRLELPTGARKRQVERAMEGHILAEATLMGRYEKGKGY